jgi:hypothetical protein
MSELWQQAKVEFAWYYLPELELEGVQYLKSSSESANGVRA